ncbi:hypothetical protein [Nitrosopumilus sp.]|uniref:hypothetical protein n=1 Tax=Nitrosopumilus sp. TaxID=2024843 RepID=UPI00247EC059|nr:hypothetical protein [Nitrosopumilus sp.]MCV0431307.1 hypothetical protein [Nitrosopumilus sp.]
MICFNMKKRGLVIAIIGLTSIAIICGLFLMNNNSDTPEISQTSNSTQWTLVKNSGSIFHVFIPAISENNSNPPSNLKFELNPENNLLYDEIRYDSTQNAIVVLPLFTASAYSNPGFYSYYTGNCDESCLTVPLVSHWKFTSSEAAILTFELLEYPFTNDYLISKNPEILNQYDAVFLLHNEYVTKSEFDAILNHPNVIYLYPNALYAEVILNSDDTISLVKGHNYPLDEIKNGFDWEFDNSPLEYDTDCNNIEFYEIDNGWMLNCYPENGFDVNPKFLKSLKDF